MSDAWIGFCGVLIGAFVALSKDIWLERRNRAKNAHYLAIRVVTLLDPFIEGCAAVASDDGLCEGYRNADDCLEPQVPEPTFDLHGLDVDWKSIPADFSYKILNLPRLASKTTDRVNDAFSWDSPPLDQSMEYRREQYAALGLKAADIASDLRKRYHLPSPDDGEWNPVEKMRQTIAVFEERRQRYDRAAVSAESVE